ATYLRLGWEGAVTPYTGSKENMRILIAGTKDTTLQLQYFNSSNSQSVMQYWTPIESKNDSVGILFRVNVAELTKKGLFDPSVNSVAVRGDQVNSSGTLSWDSNKLILKREEISVADGSFLSGVIYFPKSKIKTGTQIKYKFYVEKSKFGNWESGIADRIFSFPTKDSTLAWKFFNDKNVLTGIESDKETLPSEYSLSQTYPNPFNPETTISYKVQAASKVSLKVFDLLGREVATLVDEYKQAGNYSVTFNVETSYMASLPSGVYFYQLRADNFIATKKLVMMK
ncbi:MAG: T9SS type A sorting domain-containing protein, partial [Ignavibacteria bacterium]|nr:T9SS type A sorting domain-containing protein [Ignavibacteria bacterium]